MSQTDTEAMRMCACVHSAPGDGPTFTWDEAEAFAAAWTVLASVLREPPNDQSLEAMRSPDLLQSWPLLDSERQPSKALKDGLSSLAESKDAGEDASMVSDDHMQLLRGPGSAAASPYESVHRSREGLVFERETLQVRDWYSRFGLRAPRLDHDPDDQIHLELEFCATLLHRGLQAHDTHDEVKAQQLISAHRDFCREHLLQWAPEFFDQLLRGSKTHFYRGMAELGRDATRQAKAVLETDLPLAR